MPVPPFEGRFEMLTELQKEGLKKRVKIFIESLNEKQRRSFYFRLDDILQYGREAAELMYQEASEGF